MIIILIEPAQKIRNAQNNTNANNGPANIFKSLPPIFSLMELLCLSLL